jgi:ubiquitin C-terminal hydrolase
MKMAMEASKNPNASVNMGNIAGLSEEDQMLNQVIMQSIEQNKNELHSNSYEPLNPEQRKREPNMPCGLKNIGNTCYFNSILQVYYNLPEFVNAILEFEDNGEPLPPLSSPVPAAAQDSNP